MEHSSIALEYREGTSDKVYRAAIEQSGEGYVVDFAYGRRGTAMNTGTKTATPVSLAEATGIYTKLVRSKIAKGYRAVGTGSVSRSYEMRVMVRGYRPGRVGDICGALHAQWDFRKPTERLGRDGVMQMAGVACKGTSALSLFRKAGTPPPCSNSQFGIFSDAGRHGGRPSIIENKGSSTNWRVGLRPDRRRMPN